MGSTAHVEAVRQEGAEYHHTQLSSFCLSLTLMEGVGGGQRDQDDLQHHWFFPKNPSEPRVRGSETPLALNNGSSQVLQGQQLHFPHN